MAKDPRLEWPVTLTVPVWVVAGRLTDDAIRCELDLDGEAKELLDDPLDWLATLIADQATHPDPRIVDAVANHVDQSHVPNRDSRRGQWS